MRLLSILQETILKVELQAEQELHCSCSAVTERQLGEVVPRLSTGGALEFFSLKTLCHLAATLHSTSKHPPTPCWVNTPSLTAGGLDG